MNVKTFVRRHSNLLIVLFCILMGFLSVALLASTHIIYNNSDLAFHWYRLNELHYDLIEHRLPQFDTHSTTPYGLATMIYYPYVTLLPFSLLMFIIKSPVMLFYTIYGIIIAMMYFISYFSYQRIKKSKFQGLIFAILYSSSSIIYSNLIHSGDLGAVLAMTFLPLAFFGMMSFVRGDSSHWLMLSVGLSLVIFSHIVSAILLIGLLVIIGLMNLKQFWNVKRSLRLLKAVLLSLVTTALFWMPLLYNMFQNTIEKPQIFPNISIGILSQAFSTLNYSYGLVEILGILSIIFLKKMNYHDIYLWVIGIICLLTNFKLAGKILAQVFPPILTLQFSFRFTFLAHIIFAYLLTKFITQRLHDKRPNYLWVAILVPILLFMTIGNQSNTKFLLHTRHIIGTNEHKKNVEESYYAQPNYNDHSFHTIKHSAYNLDYAPQKLNKDNWMYTNSKALEMNGEHQSFRLIPYCSSTDGNKIKLEHRTNHLILPMVLYNGYQYDITMDGHKLPASSLDKAYLQKTSKVMVKNISAGEHIFQLKPKVPPVVNVAFYITLIGALVHVILWTWQGCRVLICRRYKYKNMYESTVKIE